MHYESHKTIVDELRNRVDTMKTSLDFDVKAKEREELQEAMNPRRGNMTMTKRMTVRIRKGKTALRV